MNFISMWSYNIA